MNHKRYSKAEVLQKIKDDLSFFKVPKLISVNAILFKNRKVSIVDNISILSESSLLAVRSSAADEDGVASSSAGEYYSFLNIPFNSVSEILN